MTVHPDAQRFLDLTAGAPPLDTQSAEQNRADLVQALPLTGEPEEMHEIRDITIAGVPVRIYIPCASDEPLPCVVFFHGGGWVIGDLELADTTVRAIAAESGAVGISVDYRLAPEHPFPAALDDAAAVLAAVLAGEPDLGIDTARVAVAGDSAGGNIAAVMAQTFCDHQPGLVHQVLIYPVTDLAGMDTGTYGTYAEGHFLTARDMAYFADQYAGGADRTDPRLSPLRNPDLGGLAPATMIIAECDPLADEGRAYGRALQSAGNQVSLIEFAGQVHPFAYMGGLIGDANVARRLIGRELKVAFGS